MRRGDIIDLNVFIREPGSSITSFEFKTPGRVKDINNCVGYWNDAGEIHWFVLINRKGNRIRREMKMTPLKMQIMHNLALSLRPHMKPVALEVEEVDNSIPYPASGPQTMPDMPEFLRR